MLCNKSLFASSSCLHSLQLFVSTICFFFGEEKGIISTYANGKSKEKL